MLFNIGFYGLSAQVQYTHSELATNAESVLARHCRELMMVQELFWAVLSEGELFGEEKLESQLGLWKRVKKVAHRKFRILLGRAEARESQLASRVRILEIARPNGALMSPAIREHMVHTAKSRIVIEEIATEILDEYVRWCRETGTPRPALSHRNDLPYSKNRRHVKGLWCRVIPEEVPIYPSQYKFRYRRPFN